MRISERLIELPRLVLLGSAAVLLLGIVAAISLPKERSPRVKFPVIIVSVPNPGSTPLINEKQIVDEIEEEADGQLGDLKDSGAIISRGYNGSAVVFFTFDNDVDVNEAKRDVESLVNRVKGEFPADAQTNPGPIISDVAFDSYPIIQVAVAGGDDAKHRRRVADDLKSQIEKVSGVARVDMFGGRDREVQIELNPHLMALYGFSFEQIESAVRRANVDVPSGSIESIGGEDQRIQSRTKVDNIESLRDIPIGTRSGKPVVLSDLAKVYLGYEPATSMARYHQQDAVVLLAIPKTDINVMGAADEIQSLVDEYSDNSDGGLRFATINSQSREIAWMFNLLLSNAFYGLILVVLILWATLGFRNASLISLSVPFAIIGAAAILWVVRKTVDPDLAINNMTLFGLILVTGMVVDGCIIVGENIYRHRELGRGGVESAKRGVSEVGGSLISAYLTTFAAFIPMFLVGGVMGDFMEQLPIVVLFALCSAVLVDHFLLPVLSVYVMKVSPKRLAKTRERVQQQQGMSPEEIEIANVETIADTNRMNRLYGGMLRYALRHRLLVLALSVVVVSMPVVLFMTGAVGLEFFPDSDLHIIQVHFELPLGSSMEKKTAEVADTIEAAVLRGVRLEEWHLPSATGERVGPMTTIGTPGALSTQPDGEHSVGPEFGVVYVELELAENRERSVKEIRQSIVDELPPMPGVIVQVESLKEGPPAGAPVMVRVMSRRQASVSLDDLAQRARHVREVLEGIPGLYDVTSDYRLRPELEVVPNRTVASLFDIDAMQIGSSVNYAIEGVRVGDVDFGGSEQFEIRIRNRLGDRDQVSDLSNLPLRSPTGKVVTLDQVAQINRVRSANVIRHYDRQRVISLRAEVEEGVLVDDVKAILVAALRSELSASEQRQLVRDRDDKPIWFDEQMLIQFGGENEVRDDALEDLNIAFIVAMVAMMIVLTVKFNNFIQPLIILFSVPLSLVGVSIGLAVCGFYFSIAAMIGVVALAGVVVNDAIVLVDFINRLRNSGVPIDRAVIYAGQMRLRPIFLTTVTTIGGLLPLGLNLSGGAEFFQPLTVTMMFGLGFATILQLFVIPLACYTFDFRSGWLDYTVGAGETEFFEQKSIKY